jgi:hypothetical protein
VERHTEFLQNEQSKHRHILQLKTTKSDWKVEAAIRHVLDSETLRDDVAQVLLDTQLRVGEQFMLNSRKCRDHSLDMALPETISWNASKVL